MHISHARCFVTIVKLNEPRINSATTEVSNLKYYASNSRIFITQNSTDDSDFVAPAWVIVTYNFTIFVLNRSLFSHFVIYCSRDLYCDPRRSDREKIKQASEGKKNRQSKDGFVYLCQSYSTFSLIKVTLQFSIHQ